MGTRKNPEYLQEQEQRRKNLVAEGVSGETIRDTLPNTSYPFQGESEAMYFKNARDFLKTTLAHRIINRNQDVI